MFVDPNRRMDIDLHGDSDGRWVSRPSGKMEWVDTPPTDDEKLREATMVVKDGAIVSLTFGDLLDALVEVLEES